MSEPTREEIARRAQEVLASPDFGRTVSEPAWRFVPDSDSSWPDWSPDFNVNLAGLGHGLAQALEVLLWVAAILALAWLARRILENMGRAAPGPVAPPHTLFGLDLRPESLPADVAGAAREAAQAGDLRRALSLLYRGALSHLARAGDLALGAALTEGECLAQVRGARPAPLAGWFETLVAAWKALAWGGRAPSQAQVLDLAESYRSHFP